MTHPFHKIKFLSLFFKVKGNISHLKVNQFRNFGKEKKLHRKRIESRL